MQFELGNQQKRDQEEFSIFVRKEVAPVAKDCDQKEYIPSELIAKLARQGYLTALLPERYGGRNMGMIAYGLLNEELGRACASTRGFVMLQNMIATSISRWGTPSQKTRWLERIASGKTIGAFALTEPDAGSDVMNLKTTVTRDGDNYIINGTKTWVTVGQIADIFLVFGQYEEQHCAFLVTRDTPGLSMEPLGGMLGIRGSQLAQLSLGGCRVPEENLVGNIGFGFSAVAAQALNLGRYSIAWGCVGMAQDCLEASIQHASARKQFGVLLKEHQLIQKMIADMHVNINAARLLCYQAAHAEESNMPDAYMKTMIAKYFASRMASQVTNDAVQIHGALGCSETNPAQRHMRDAKIMEIIEGTTQIHQIKIAEHAFQEFMDE